MLVVASKQSLRRVSRENREMAAAQGSERAEVSFVECEDSPGPKSVSHDDDAEVRQSRVEVLVASFEVDDDAMVLGV